MAFEERAEEAVPAEDIFVFSASSDGEQAFEIDNALELPDTNGKSGGACTSALLQTLWHEDDDEDVRYSWADTLDVMREKIYDLGLDQSPQLSSSRPIDVDEEVFIVPSNCDGVKRALLVGINYTGDENALSSCHQDIKNMKDFLINLQGFERQNISILMDDRNHHEPNKDIILKSLQRLCEISRPGDCIFIQFSGHGAQLKNGKDKLFFPRDYAEAGLITDDEMYAEFVSQIQPGVHVVALMDNCHSGTVIDLPYVCGVGEEGFRENASFKPAMAGTVAAAGKKKKGKKNDQDKKSKKKKEGDSNDKKKKSKDGTKKKKKKDIEEAPATTEDKEEEEESFEEVEREEPKKKKKGLFGFGRKK